MARVPPGYVFAPTDLQVIQYFLPLMVSGGALDNYEIITDCDIYGDLEPWRIFDQRYKKDYYVFVKLKKTNSGNRNKRTAGSGKWNIQHTYEIKDAQDRAVGFNRMLRFEVPEHLSFTAAGNGRWIMHEYSTGTNADQVICKITNKDARLEENYQQSQQWSDQLANLPLNIDTDGITGWEESEIALDQSLQ